MPRFRKPHPVPLLFTLAAVMLCAGLGAWQLKRLAWKEAQLAAIAIAQSEPPLAALPQDVAQAQYRKVALVGRFGRDSLRFIGRASGGYLYYTPFTLDDSDETVLVNRGWFAEGTPPPQGVTTVEGYIRAPKPERLFSPANSADKNLWFVEDIPHMEQSLQTKLFPAIVETGVPPALRNDHLGYAVSWFLLALAAAVMFAVYQREKQA